MSTEILALVAGLASVVAVLGGIITVVWQLSAMSTKIDALVAALEAHSNTKERLARLETAVFNQVHE